MEAKQIAAVLFIGIVAFISSIHIIVDMHDKYSNANTSILSVIIIFCILVLSILCIGFILD